VHIFGKKNVKGMNELDGLDIRSEQVYGDSAMGIPRQVSLTDFPTLSPQAGTEEVLPTFSELTIEEAAIPKVHFVGDTSPTQLVPRKKKFIFPPPAPLINIRLALTHGDPMEDAWWREHKAKMEEKRRLPEPKSPEAKRTPVIRKTNAKPKVKTARTRRHKSLPKSEVAGHIKTPEKRKSPVVKLGKTLQVVRPKAHSVRKKKSGKERTEGRKMFNTLPGDMTGILASGGDPLVNVVPFGNPEHETERSVYEQKLMDAV
jgi:hypothetical protein